LIVVVSPLVLRREPGDDDHEIRALRRRRTAAVVQDDVHAGRRGGLDAVEGADGLRWIHVHATATEIADARVLREVDGAVRLHAL